MMIAVGAQNLSVHEVVPRHSMSAVASLQADKYDVIHSPACDKASEFRASGSPANLRNLNL